MRKNLPATQETGVRSLDQEDPLEKGMATQSSIPAWRIPWTEERYGLQSMGRKELDMTKRLTCTQIWFTMLCEFQVYSKVNQLYIYIYLKLNLQYFGHLMRRDSLLEKTLLLGKVEAKRGRGSREWDGWMATLTQWTWVWASSGRQWRTGCAAVHGSQRVRHDLASEQQTHVSTLF